MTELDAEDFPIDCLVRVVNSNGSSETFKGHDRIGKVTGHHSGANMVLVAGHFTHLQEQAFPPRFLERIEIQRLGDS